MKIFRTSKKHRPKVSYAPEGKRLYAIGDVHGCFEHLRGLLKLIKRDIAKHDKRENYIVFLGDLIDRGDQSSKVVKTVMKMCRKIENCYCLMGNHEEMFLKGYNGDLESLDSWLQYGGRETLISYGISQKSLANSEIDQIHLMMKKTIPANHMKFLAECLDCIDFGDYFLVHAGIDPSSPFHEQERKSFLWMREPFLSYAGPLEKVVIHGHTVVPKAERISNRIAVDTGAYKGGALSAVCLEEDQLRILEFVLPS